MAALTSHGFWTDAHGSGEKRLSLSRLTLSEFRNYGRCTLTLDGQSVVLTGRNGSGKTNILEAVSLLAPGRGLRGAPFAELARLTGDGGWAVSARLQRDGDDVTLGTGQQAPAQTGATGRLVRVDGEPAAGSGSLGDYLQIVWLIPAMDGLFTGPGSDRRRFLDRIVSTFDSAHRRRLNHFERAMRQRNRLFETGERSGRLFEAIESQMAETGTAVAAARIEAAERLADAAIGQADGAGTAFPNAILALEGTLEAALQTAAAIDVEDNYARQLADNRERDRAAGRALLGPHRSDLLVRHGPKDMPANLCSTGEQKALLIGLVLAHAKAVKDMAGGLAPLLLLDEIAAHLDALRREALFEEIERLGSQAWLTGTDHEVFEPLRQNAQFLTVADGAVASTGHRTMPPAVRPISTGYKE